VVTGGVVVPVTGGVVVPGWVVTGGVVVPVVAGGCVAVPGCVWVVVAGGCCTTTGGVAGGLSDEGAVVIGILINCKSAFWRLRLDETLDIAFWTAVELPSPSLTRTIFLWRLPGMEAE